MIISVSRRTDIPALYPEWFIENLRIGYIQYKNPFNPSQIIKISLKKEDVDLFVFWSKNPSPFINYLDELVNLGYKFFFHFTLNNYYKEIEPNIPDYEKRIEIFKLLSNKIGKEKVILRYDPIIISNITNFDFHIEKFSNLINELKDYTNRVIISFYKDYKKSTNRLEKLGIKILDNYIENKYFIPFLKEIAKIAKNNNLEIFSCAEKLDFTEYGIPKGKCIDNEYIKKVFNIDLKYKKDTGQRKECRCIISKDIGTYNTCFNKCSYCYANNNKIKKI